MGLNVVKIAQPFQNATFSQEGNLCAFYKQPDLGLASKTLTCQFAAGNILIVAADSDIVSAGFTCKMGSIFVTAGRQKGDYYPLGGRTNVIGRAEANPIQILDDRISRKHVQVYFDRDKQHYYALDMKSRHGTFLNGARIDAETRLVDGDQIQIGDTILLFADKEFPDYESALSHFRKVGEQIRPTLID